MPSRSAIVCRSSMLLVAWLAAPLSFAETGVPAPMQQLLQLTGIDSADVVPAPAELALSPTRDRQLPMYRELIGKPLQAPFRAGIVADAFRDAASSPHDLIALTGALSGLKDARSKPGALQDVERKLRLATDPLAASVAWMVSPGSRSALPVPDQASLPAPLRFELAMMLATMGNAHEALQRAFDRLPASITPALLRRQVVEGQDSRPGEPDFRRWLPAVDRQALLTGMLDLVAAVQRLRQFVATTSTLPSVQWQVDTPYGRIVVDTTGRDNAHDLADPLLVVDVGGNDRYEFQARGAHRRLCVLLDHGGNDQYVARSPGADASAAILGYGILWDTEGDDQYRGTTLAQGAALLGASLVVDGGGNNEFEANGHAQAYAVGGWAVLLSGAGSDRFKAQTHAQGSAGPEGVAVQMDAGGNDRYLLDNMPLLAASPQLPTHNTSMGQGAGHGIRHPDRDALSTAGGIGMLLDLAGDDHYSAQVFAQGVGFQEGMGLLVDAGGNDRFDAAWYAMGAAAHRGVGTLLKRGNGDDRYDASHSTSIGAAHDQSAAYFLDEGGNDRYRVGDLGLGAAHEGGIAVFMDVAGHDAYGVGAPSCRALGVAPVSQLGPRREGLPNVGLFLDLGGDDAYPAHCGRARNDAAWKTPRARPDLPPGSEAGAGIDGQFLAPFATMPQAAPHLRSPS